MKRILTLLALLGVLVVTGCSASGSAVQTLDPQAFLTSASQPNVTVIDVRTPQEFAAGHLPGAVNIDVEAPDFAGQIQRLDVQGTFAVYCHSGRRSAIAADAMAQAGFTHIINLQGGLADLQSAGGAVVTS